MDVIELIKRGYAALGLGAPQDVLAMFDQLEDSRPWTVRNYAESPRQRPSREVAALELFSGLPHQYEIIGVDPESWKLDKRREVLTVSGHYRTRPRGTWDVFTLPFVHVWSIGGGHVQRVLSALDGVELWRLPVAA
jgi:hypothetical protein